MAATWTTPPRLSLAQLPTPLQPSSRLGAELGVELWWKRDDHTGVELSGNKIRKLEFLLAEARAQGADTIITCGGEQSNHCRATAVAAVRLGMRPALFLRVPDPATPPAPAANSLLDRMVGAEVHYITPAQYRQRNELMAAHAEGLRRAGRRPYVIPEGGSSALGCWGYIQAVAELRAQLGPGPVTLVYAAGSGGTGAGLELGVRLHGWTEARVVGFAVCDDAAYFQGVMAQLGAEAAERFGLPVSFTAEQVSILDRYKGPGYAQSTPEMLAALVRVARADGVVLDPVYTGKAAFGLLAELAQNRDAFGPRVVFFHTGGLFGLFPFAEALRGVLGGP